MMFSGKKVMFNISVLLKTTPKDYEALSKA